MITSSSPVVDPIIVKHRAGLSSATVELLVPSNLHFFRGHFPGAPVVPGVVQIKWAIALAQRYFAIGESFAGLENVKFQRAMTPRARLTLTLEFEASVSKLSFLFASADARYSSGRVLLGTVR
jgi:3-hydroxymyristoyl/3-hydroxydecanoyl-(acyl carrier protein) dehydratase